MLLLPPPEGAATTNRQPEAGGPWVVIVMGKLAVSRARSRGAGPSGLGSPSARPPRSYGGLLARPAEDAASRVGRPQSRGAGPSGLGSPSARPPRSYGGLLARPAEDAASRVGRPQSRGAGPSGLGSPSARPPRSFDVLHLLAHLLDQHLELERDLRHLGVDRLGAERIGLAMQLLREEIEALAR